LAGMWLRDFDQFFWSRGIFFLFFGRSAGRLAFQLSRTAFSSKMEPKIISSECDFTMKMILLGSAGVGKSCIMKMYKGEQFDVAYNSTIGVDFEIKPIQYHGLTINLQIWDTAGQERFRTITSSYYRSADAIMLVFDVTDPESFHNLEDWMTEVRLYDPKPMMLIGNKVDMTDNRKIEYKQAKEYADKNGMPYMETSARGNLNIHQAFKSLTEAAAQQRIKQEQITPKRKPKASASGKSKKGKGKGGKKASASNKPIVITAQSESEARAKGCAC